MVAALSPTKRASHQLGKGTSLAGSKSSISGFEIKSSPSTDAGTERSVSSNSLLTESPTSPSKDNLRKSFALAVGSASKSYIEQAEQLLSEESSSICIDQNDQSFLEAMARQGVKLSDLEADSKLSYARRKSLLAAVLQDKETHSSALSPLSPRSPSKASIFQQQVRDNFEKSLERTLKNEQRYELVSHNKGQVAQGKRAQFEEKSSVEQAKAERLKAKEAEEADSRLDQAFSRNSEWSITVEQGEMRLSQRVAERQASIDEGEKRLQKQLQANESDRELIRSNSQQHFEHVEATAEQGADRLAERVADRQAFLEAQDNRLAEQNQRLQEQTQQNQARLKSRFLLVQQSADQARQDAEDRARELHEALQRNLQKSQEHQQDVQQNLEEERQLKAEKRQEREHQRDRVERIKELQRSERNAAISEDSAIFAESRHLQERLSAELSQRGSRKMSPR